MSNRLNQSLMTKEEKQFPLEIKDVKQIPKEKIISARIGVESDTYLHHAVKCKRLDLLKFLLKEVTEIDLATRNSQGSTVLHLAVKSGSIQMLKTVFIADQQNIDELLKTNTINDMKGNINMKAVKLLQMQNNKGMTPLIATVDQPSVEMFKFLFELMNHLQKTQAKIQVLTDSIDLTDIKQETALLKAVRTNQLEMAKIILSNMSPNHLLSYESLLICDISMRNVLHYAVINKQKDLVQKLIELDSDASALRKQKDTKQKLP